VSDVLLFQQKYLDSDLLVLPLTARVACKIAHW